MVAVAAAVVVEVVAAGRLVRWAQERTACPSLSYREHVSVATNCTGAVGRKKEKKNKKEKKEKKKKKKRKRKKENQYREASCNASP